MNVRGTFTVWDIIDGVWTPCFSQQNNTLVGAGFAIVKLLGDGDRNYRISRIYAEYENVADPDDVVSPPAVQRSSGLEYYTNLVAPRDYLRLAVARTPEISIAPGYESYYVAGQSGNVLTVYGQTSDGDGVNGLTFSAGANSKVFGVGLVAAPADGDPSQDIILARGYYPTNKQRVKSTTAQLGVSWKFEMLLDL